MKRRGEPNGGGAGMRAVRAVLGAAGILLAAAASRAGVLPVAPGRGGPFDLNLSGSIEGLPAGGWGHLRRADLLALPATTLAVRDELGPRIQTVRAIFLSDLLARLPLRRGADLVLAECSDGYLSVYPLAFIRAYRPFLIVSVGGRGPADWPALGVPAGAGPYVIDVSTELVPAAARLRDLGHKQPWGVVALRVTTVADAFGALYRGRWAGLGAAAADGRDIWINSCASCHFGPDGATGGSKAGRPFAVVAAFAAAAPDFLRQYVRDPQSLMPGAKMEPHPYYSRRDLDDLIAFLTAGQNGGPKAP